MLFEKGPENDIRCRVINGWFKMDSYVYTQEKLLMEIGRVKPDVVVMDFGLKVSQSLRSPGLSRFDVPVIYV
jgi:hypothetical protein